MMKNFVEAVTRANRVGAGEISTGPSPIERRVGLACAVAKLNMGA